MNKLKIVFIGGLSNGKIVFDYLSRNKYVELSLAITYKDEDSNKARFVDFPSADFIKKTSSANSLVDKIINLKPDFIFVAGWSELLNSDILTAAKRGVIGFHPAKLPADRGRSVLAWQIEDGYKETALTMFYYNNIPDGGDIIGREIMTICEFETINDILNKCDEATFNLMSSYFPLLRQNIAPRIKQNEDFITYRRLRTDRDSLINWHISAKNIFNKIRAIAKPYPGADTFYNGKKIKIWKAKIIKNQDIDNMFLTASCGEVVAKFANDKYWIKTLDNLLEIISEEELLPGKILG